MSDGQFTSELNAPPIEIHTGTTTIIKGQINTNATEETDDDDFTIHLADNAVLVFETSNADSQDANCDRIDVELTGSWLVTQTKEKDGVSYDVGIGRCAATTHYLLKDSTHSLTIKSKKIKDSQPAGYVVKIHSLPVKADSDVTPDVPLISDKDFTNKEEIYIAINGLASISKPDQFQIDVTKKDVRIELIEGLPTREYSCENFDYDFKISVDFEMDKKEDLLNYKGGRGECPMLDGFGPNAKDPQISSVNGLTGLKITPFSGGVAPYTLVISARPAIEK